MKDKQAKYPQLRFKGFTDPWVQRKLTDVGDIARGKSKHRPRNDKKLFGGKYPFVQTGDVASAGLFLTNYSQTYNEFGLAQSKLWPSGTLLITIAANIAEASILGIDAAFPDSIIGFTAKNSDVVFIKTLIDKFSNGLKRKAETSSQANLNLAKLSDLDIVVPNYDEQKQISSFFQNLDNLIAANQRKLDLLKEQKKGYLQKMFPKNGAKVPELRFAGFTDAWEQRKLGEVATFLNGRAYKQDELLDSGKYKVLRVGNFYTNDSWYYSNMELGDKYYVDKGDLVYTWSATFGPHIWSGEKVIYHYHIWKVELSKFLDRNFTLQLLEADKARLLSSTNGSTMIHVTKGDMESKIVSIPNIDEQKQIGSFFKQLDDTIALHQRKLDLLKEQKKGFLQNMFV